MYWQDYVLKAVFFIIPVTITAVYSIYWFLSLFVSIERKEIDEPITTEDFKKQYTKEPEKAKTILYPKEAMKYFHELKQKGILGKDAEFFDWAKHQNRFEIIDQPLEIVEEK